MNFESSSKSSWFSVFCCWTSITNMQGKAMPLYICCWRHAKRFVTVFTNDRRTHHFAIFYFAPMTVTLRTIFFPTWLCLHWEQLWAVEDSHHICVNERSNFVLAINLRSQIRFVSCHFRGDANGAWENWILVLRLASFLVAGSCCNIQDVFSKHPSKPFNPHNSISVRVSHVIVVSMIATEFPNICDCHTN